MAVIVGIIYLVTRPTTWFGKMQLALTGLLGIVFVGEVEAAMWLHSMAHGDPVRQLWQPRINEVSMFVWFGSLVGYAVFTFYHLVARSKTSPR